MSMSNSSSNVKEFPKRILIVGGVAGGATAAARARRVDSNAEITIVEKTKHISFANCGLPYHIGGEIEDRAKLIVSTSEMFWKRFRVRVLAEHEAIAIDRKRRLVKIIELKTQNEIFLPYDRLIIATGSEPITPEEFQPLSSNVFHLWTLNDMDRVNSYVAKHEVKSAVVLGGGYVGLEVAEQLKRKGLATTLLERNPRLLKTVDPEFSALVRKEVESNDVRCIFSVLKIVPEVTNEKVDSVTIDCAERSEKLKTELVLLCTGVKPRIELARDCGLTIGKTGGVIVDQRGKTSDSKIFAVGDIAELSRSYLNAFSRIPLAGPANRLGRIAGTQAALGKSGGLGELYGTSIVRVFGLTVACTGANQDALRKRKIKHRSVIVQAPHHASYFPGAKNLTIKLSYTSPGGQVLGCQVLGAEGVDKRIDVVATLMKFGGTVFDLAQLDLAYAPPFSSAKDPLHQAAFAASNDLGKHPRLLPPESDLTGLQVIDVRTKKERDQLPLEGAIPIEIDELNDRWQELDPQKPSVVVCHSAKRAHIGACLLIGKGFKDVRNLSGGMSIRSLLAPG